MRAFLVAAALAAASIQALPVFAEEKPPQQPDDPHRCVIVRTISGWSRIDDRTLLLRAAGKKFKVSFYSPCYEANWAFAARVDHPGMCLREGDVLIFDISSSPMGPRWNDWGHHGFEERCLIRSIELVPPSP